MKSVATDQSVLVIGFGNALRGDDGAGPAAARRLERTLPAGSANVLTVHQLLPELAEAASRARYVIFIDARRGGAPGQIVRQTVASSPESRAVMAHDLSPAGIVALAGQLYGRAPEAVLYSISGTHFGYGRRLSPTVRKGLDELVRQVAADVRGHGAWCHS